MIFHILGDLLARGRLGRVGYPVEDGREEIDQEVFGVGDFIDQENTLNLAKRGKDVFMLGVVGVGGIPQGG